MLTHCAKCDKSFETYPYKIKKHKNLFCSTICQYAFKRTSSVLVCRICSNSFQASAHRIKNQKECFCTKKCADKALVVPRIKKKCKVCSTQFEFLESRLKHSNRAFCSIECFYENQKNQIDKICECCEKQFSVSKSKGIGGKGRFCSRECVVKFSVKEKAAAYKHGHGWFKKMSKETRSKTCEICEKVGKTDIHHIDGNERNNTVENFITLCRSCHMRIHHLSGRRNIEISKALEIFKIIKDLPRRSHSTWLLVEDLKKR